MQKIKTCAVEYLNTRPIVYGLQQAAAARFELQYAIPSVCADKLKNKEVDLALIPSIEYSRIRGHRNLRIVPDIGVISHQFVKSVELFFNRNLENINTVAVDISSRTSVGLLDIILREKFDIHPEFIPMPPQVEVMLSKADAALIIGDNALELYDTWDNKIDLGEEWGDMTDGLPFVYSFWAAAEDALNTEDILILTASRDAGLDHITEISRVYSQERARGFEPDFYANYLTENIQYKLGKAELEGLKEYYSYCFYYGIIDEIPDLLFVGQENESDFTVKNN